MELSEMDCNYQERADIREYIKLFRKFCNIASFYYKVLIYLNIVVCSAPETVFMAYYFSKSK